MCQKNRDAKSGHSNVQHGDHNNKVNKNTRQRNDTTNTTPTLEDTSDIKWVRNTSSKPLTEAQVKLLSHGPNYAVVPKKPPTIEYIAAIEKACASLQPGKAEELRGEVKANIKKMQLPKLNLTKEEHKALEELKKDKTRMILTVDKGVSIVMLDREEYIKKADELLSQSSYKKISTDPTNRYKSRLITLLKKIKTEGGMYEATYRRLYPTEASPPKFYGLPKVHKSGMPLRPIVSSIGSVTYQTAKELSRILKPLVGRSPHHVQNNQDFLKQLEEIKMGPDDIIMSYDVRALFTSVPIKPALKVIQKFLEEDHTLPQRTTMTVKNITCLLEFCLTSTYFTFQEKFYEQVEGAAMSSPLSPIVANLYMEDFEMRALNTAPQPPLMWKRYVDDTCVIIKAAQKQSFLDHINSIDKNIQFTSEEPTSNEAIPFLDILLTPGEDGKISTSVFRKSTHTDLYMQWDSNHDISAKYSVIGTLHHRANTISSSPELLQKEEKHLKKVLARCKYPEWAINRVKIKMRTPAQGSQQKKKSCKNANPKQNYIVVPYYKGLGESLKRTCQKYGVQVYFKGGNTIKSLLIAPKDKDPLMKKSGVIYRYKCDRVECDEEYIGESSRNFGERFKEHQKAPSPIYDHHNTTGHNINIENFEIVGRESQNLMRTIKEALYIRVNDPSLNRNIGKYHLPHIWDEVLFNISELKLKN